MSTPHLSRSYHLRFLGDWGGANFHRICSWLCEEFCNRSGPRSRVAILSLRDGGMEAIEAVEDGDADLSLSTPAMLMSQALTGKGMFMGRAAPHLRALAVLPQNDRMVLAIRSDLKITSFEQLRRERPALRIAATRNDGTSFVGHVARLFMHAHGIPDATLGDWRGCYVEDTNPLHTLQRMQKGEADAVLQEAIMTPWWADLVESGKVIPLPAEEDALSQLKTEHGLISNPLPAGFWSTLKAPLPALDFSDFVVLVRDDMPEELAHMLTLCLVETRETIERQYRHLPPHRSPLSYPLVPERMARTPLPLHPGSERYYREAGVLAA